MTRLRLFQATVCALCLCAHYAHSQSTEHESASFVRHVTDHAGDATKGEQLFLNHEKLLCTNCHNINGMEKSGPNLEGIADKFNREQLIEQLLFPSKAIKPGFEQVTVITRQGKSHVGRVERINQTVHRIIDGQGKQLNIPSDDVESVVTSEVSLMPSNLWSVISREEFADLIAYLQTLSFGIHDGLVAGGRSIPIGHLKREVHFRSINSDTPFENPVWCGALLGTKNDLLVIEQHTSKIWRLKRPDFATSKDTKPAGPESLPKSLFLDLSGETYISNNQGLMCMALHPEYATNRRYFLKHEVKEAGEVKTTVVERQASPDGLRDSGAPSRRLLEVAQPAFNHNGGCLEFGPDGMLYIAFGDGGPQKDPPGFSQNPRVFHGSMLRIDVNRRDEGRAYAIPLDNPYVGAHENDPEIRPETWATGFREPWRFSFDSVTGDLYLGDVGQDKFEEVCIVRRGENHGWNVREAFAPFSDEYQRDGQHYTEPLFAYEHGLGFSITGGFVYRGKQNTSFYGVYVFGDYNTRRVWGLKQSEGKVKSVVQIGTAPGGIASFGVDQQGEIYLVAYMGSIYHIDLAGVVFP